MAAVKVWELEPFKQQASLAFSLVPTSEVSRNARLIFHSTVPLAAVAKTSNSQSHENVTLLFQMTQTQIELKFPHDS